MEPIHCGTTTERIVRTTILTVLLVGCSLWCFWDGQYRYPRRNLEALKENLTPVPVTPPEINRNVTEAKVESLHKRAQKDKQDVTKAEVVALLGEPAAREDDRSFFFGPGGMARIVFKNGLVTKVKWFHGREKESDLFTQLLMGCVIGALGLGMILQMIRVVTTRAELTDAGLKVNSQGGTRWGGSPLVPFEAMTGLGTEDYKKKGWVEVEYRLADGIEGKVSLNDYVHKAFPQIVGEICRRRGFDNPIKHIDEQEEHADADAGLICPNQDCGHRNLATAKFCCRCGGAIAPANGGPRPGKPGACPLEHTAAAHSPDGRYCLQCGVALDGPAKADSAADTAYAGS